MSKKVHCYYALDCIAIITDSHPEDIKYYVLGSEDICSYSADIV